MRFPARLSHILPRGVGVGCNDIVEPARMVDATSPVGLGWGGMGCDNISLHMNTCSMLPNSCVSRWDVNVPCTCTHVQCYATPAFLAGMLTFLAIAHMFNATQLLRFLPGC